MPHGRFCKQFALVGEAAGIDDEERLRANPTDTVVTIARDTGFSEEHMATDYATLVGQGIPHDEALAELRRIYSRTLHAAIRRLSRAIFGRKQEPTDRR